RSLLSTAPPSTALYTLSLHTLFRSWSDGAPTSRRVLTSRRRPARHRPTDDLDEEDSHGARTPAPPHRPARRAPSRRRPRGLGRRSEEHTSELQSRENLVCRLHLEKK